MYHAGRKIKEGPIVGYAGSATYSKRLFRAPRLIGLSVVPLRPLTYESCPAPTKFLKPLLAHSYKDGLTKTSKVDNQVMLKSISNILFRETNA